MSETAILRTHSHRARDRLDSLLGFHPQYYWTWDAGGIFAEVPQNRVAEARKLKGITLARIKRNELRACWNK